MRKRHLLSLAAAAAALVGLPLAATAQTYPDKPVRIVVPYPPGGFNDTLARTLAKHLTADWKQTVVVDNKPGGNTIIGNSAVATAPADGYTLLITPFPFAVLPALYGAKLPYDPIKSFQPVTWAAYTQNLLVVRKNFPAKNVAELIDYVRKNPGKVNYASTGSGSSNHLSAELFKSMTRTDLTHIPYKGSAPAVSAMLAGEADLLFDNMPNVMQHVKAGNLIPIAVTGKERSALMPDTPTLHEAGVPGYELLVWFGIQAPAGTPRPVVAKINEQMAKVLQLPEVVRDFRAQGVEVVASPPERFGELLKSEIAKWGKLVSDAKITVE